MGYLSCLQHRDATLRYPSAAPSRKPYPGKLTRPYHQLPHGAPTKPLLRTWLRDRLGMHGAKITLILMVAVVFSLYMCVMAVSQLAAPSKMVAAHQESSLLQPGARQLHNKAYSPVYCLVILLCNEPCLFT